MNQCPRCLKQFRTVFGDAEMQEIVHTCTPTKEWREMEEATEKSSKEIERLNALVAMQAEALKAVNNADIRWNHDVHIEKQVELAISASSSTVAKWEAEKLLPLQQKLAGSENMVALQAEAIAGLLKRVDEIEPLQRQVAMLRSLLDKLEYNEFGAKRCPDEDDVNNALSNTQATAEAYDREHAEKVLEKLRARLVAEQCSSSHPYSAIDAELATLRATKQVKEQTMNAKELYNSLNDSPISLNNTLVEYATRLEKENEQLKLNLRQQAEAIANTINRHHEEVAMLEARIDSLK